MTNRRVFVYGETRHKNLSSTDEDYSTFQTKSSANVKPRQHATDNLNNSDFFVNNSNSSNYIQKKKVDLKEEDLYKQTTPSVEAQKKVEYIYVLRDNNLNDDNEFGAPVDGSYYSRKYVPAEKKPVDLSRTQSMEYLKPSEKTYFHELKFDKRLKRKPSVRCEIEEPVLHEKPMPNRAVIRNGSIVYK